MLKQALLAPVRSSDALPTLLIGSALVVLAAVVASAVGFLAVRTPAGLVLVPLAVLLPLVVLGYELRVLRAGVRGERGTPSFVDWSGLVRGGVASLAVTLGYLLPGVVLAVGATALWIGFHDAAGVVPRSALGREAARFGGAALAGLYGLLLLPLRPAALSVYATTGRFRDAFALRRVLGVLATGRFVLGWALGSLVVLAGVVAFPFAFYARVVAHSLYGRAAAPTLGDGRSSDAAPVADRPAGEAGDADARAGRDLALDPGAPDADGTADVPAGATRNGRADAAGSEPSADGAPRPSLDAYDPDELRVAPDDAETGRLEDPDDAFASFDPVADESEAGGGLVGDGDADESEAGGGLVGDGDADESEAGGGLVGDGDAGEDGTGGDGDEDGFEWGRTE
jgi:hypothetical protein